MKRKKLFAVLAAMPFIILASAFLTTAYVMFHLDSPYGAVAVVPNDPRCTGGK